MSNQTLWQALRKFAGRYLLADATPLSATERWRSALAAMLGMLLIEAILTVLPGSAANHRLLAPLGATSVILFALPHSPLGQPWPAAGGLLLSALAGLVCGTWIQPVWLAIALSVGISVWVMTWLRCLHPPGGAMAVLFASGAASMQGHDMGTALLNVAAVLAAALAVNAAIPGRRWPQCSPDLPRSRPKNQVTRTGIRHEDLQHALTRIDSFLDITEEDLVQVYDLALSHAHERHDKRICGDIMTTDVVSVEFGTELNEAWALLRRHHLKVLPVLDRGQRVIGMISADNFLDHVAPDGGLVIAENIRRLLRPSPGSYSNKPEVVGQIMSEDVVVAKTTDPISRIAAILAGRKHPPALPVVGEDGKLAGILGQTDLLAALYHAQAVNIATRKTQT